VYTTDFKKAPDEVFDYLHINEEDRVIWPGYDNPRVVDNIRAGYKRAKEDYIQSTKDKVVSNIKDE
jgi:hypothetical protein